MEIQFIPKDSKKVTGNILMLCKNCTISEFGKWSIETFEGVKYCVIQKKSRLNYFDLLPIFYKQKQFSRIFKHVGPGVHVGSYIIVKAETLAEAQRVIRDKLKEIGLKDEVLNVKEHNFSKSRFVHINNGDY